MKVGKLLKSIIGQEVTSNSGMKVKLVRRVPNLVHASIL